MTVSTFESFHAYHKHDGALNNALHVECKFMKKVVKVITCDVRVENTMVFFLCTLCKVAWNISC